MRSASVSATCRSSRACGPSVFSSRTRKSEFWIAWSGLLSSWATEATSRPIAASFSVCTSRVRIDCS